jgi:hypothetical protein
MPFDALLRDIPQLPGSVLCEYRLHDLGGVVEGGAETISLRRVS